MLRRISRPVSSCNTHAPLHLAQVAQRYATQHLTAAGAHVAVGPVVRRPWLNNHSCVTFGKPVISSFENCTRIPKSLNVVCKYDVDTLNEENSEANHTQSYRGFVRTTRCWRRVSLRICASDYMNRRWRMAFGNKKWRLNYLRKWNQRIKSQTS